MLFVQLKNDIPVIESAISIPSFLVDQNDLNSEVTKSNLLAAIRILNDFLEKSILTPSNIHFPQERINFFNNLN